MGLRDREKMNKNKKGDICIPGFFHQVIGYIRTSFHLPYRQTEGIIKATGKRLPANPSYGHICIRMNKLTINIKKDKIDDDDLIISIDITGIKVLSFLDSKRKSVDDDLEMKWITTWNYI